MNTTQLALVWPTTVALAYTLGGWTVAVQHARRSQKRADALTEDARIWAALSTQDDTND